MEEMVLLARGRGSGVLLDVQEEEEGEELVVPTPRATSYISVPTARYIQGGKHRICHPLLTHFHWTPPDYPRKSIISIL